MSREQIIAAIQTCARKLKRIPTRTELKQITGVSYPMVRHGFGNMARAFCEAGLEPTARGQVIITEDLLLDWAQVARKLGKLPGVTPMSASDATRAHPSFIAISRGLLYPPLSVNSRAKKPWKKNGKTCSVSSAPRPSSRARRIQQQQTNRQRANHSFINHSFISH
jgi:hypothetical protein